jgi:putative thioredoxin
MLFGMGRAETDTAQGGEIIFDADINNFEDAVIRGSTSKPILVDFWSPSCAPCNELTPRLEQAVTETNGEVLLAKVNIDKNPELAAAMQVMSVPTVFAFFQGQPVTAFQGAQPQSEIKKLIDNLVKTARQMQPDAIDIPKALEEAAEALAEDKTETAQALYAQILMQDETHVQAYIGLIRTFIAMGDLDQARHAIDSAPEEIAKNTNFEAAKSALELAESGPSGDLAELQAAVEKNPDDHVSRFDLSLALFSINKKEEAINDLIEIISRDREWEDEKARKQLLKFFEAMGPSDPDTIQGRRKLSSILFS